jgi:phosphoribosylaminoimidazolecarboxamide formyltransferase/IMP cyclohydrolase
MKRALVSVSDKTGLLEFLKPLYVAGLEIVSTGGTLKYLQGAGFKATDVSQVTNFPEVLDGRVKTLHPNIHMGLLARKELQTHIDQMSEFNVQWFDLVVGNLYPFEKTAVNLNSTFEEQIENIDIGGPSFLRSAAKNFQNVVVVSDPADYLWLLEKLQKNNLTLEDRKKLAIKVYSLTSYYDAMIVQKLSTEEIKNELMYLNIPLRRKQNLRYGENAHQKASWFQNPLDLKNLASAEIIQGKELSYNNLLDLDAAAGLVTEFTDPACVAVKHNNPCGVAIGETVFAAAQKAVQSDPQSVFGGIIAFNQTVDHLTADFLSSIFLECIIAPNYTIEALDLFSKKKNLRILKWPDLLKKTESVQYKSIQGGLLVQDPDRFNTLNSTQIGAMPSDQVSRDMIFGEKVCAYLKSNAIAIVYNGQTVGLGMGQVNRVDSVRIALDRFHKFLLNKNIPISDVVVVSDAFFPFADSIEVLQKEGLRWIFQPGGSVKDSEVIEYVKAHSMNMILSGVRHFKH